MANGVVRTANWIKITINYIILSLRNLGLHDLNELHLIIIGGQKNIVRSDR